MIAGSRPPEGAASRGQEPPCGQAQGAFKVHRACEGSISARAPAKEERGKRHCKSIAADNKRLRSCAAPHSRRVPTSTENMIPFFPEYGSLTLAGIPAASKSALFEIRFAPAP